VLRAAASSGGWHHVAAACVPAVLQTLLLRLEERIFVDHSEQFGLEETYLDILHGVLSVGEPAAVAAETSRWPLHRGWSRVQGLRRALRNLAATEQERSVDFVLCFCSVARSPGGGYPAVEDELGWLSELLSPEADLYRNSTRIYVKEKCGDAAMPGAEESLREALLPFAKVVEVTRVDDELRADDATAYLDHLAGPNYDDLAAWTFFLHADAPEHVHPFRLLEEVLSAVRSGLLEQDTFPFLYLSHNFLDLGSSLHTWDNFASPRLWKRLFGSSIAPPREAVKGYCCVQFLVPRRRALLRSRAWYATALAYFASEVSYFELFPWGRLVTWQDLTCRAPAQLWMPWWHVVFGEELACPERHQDPRLPLFVQLRSIPPDRIHCC
ncbi:amt, partial [Symbiodinium sp. CCMP2456]